MAMGNGYADSREKPNEQADTEEYHGISDQNKWEIGLAVVLVLITVAYFAFKYTYRQQVHQPSQQDNEVKTFCTSCGKNLQTLCQFCGHCGAKVTTDEQTETGSDYVHVSEDSLSEVMQNLEAEDVKGTLQALNVHLQKLGVHGADFVHKTLEDDLEKWKKVSIDIAVTGESGSGKSSLINSMRGITADDKGGAKVGSKETTTECQMYPHPTHQNLVLWDLPGVGTSKFPAKSYRKDVELDKYDFFIIVSQSRFTENDIWLAKSVLKLGKKFYFIRSKADNEVKDNRQAHPTSHDAKRLIKDIRDDCKEKLRAGGVNDPQVFVINSYNQNEYDYQIFEITLIRQAPQLKRDAFVLAFPALNPGVIDEKKAVLAGRKWKVAIFASLGSALPIPGSGMACEATVLLSEVRFYCEQLGIGKESITKIAKTMKVSVKDLREQWGVTVFQTVASPRTFVQYLGQLCVTEYVETTAKICLPFIGSLIAVGISYPFCVYSLQTMLNMCAKEALVTRLRFTTWLNGETPV